MTWIKVYCVKTIEDSKTKIFREKEEAEKFINKMREEGYICYKQTYVWG